MKKQIKKREKICCNIFFPPILSPDIQIFFNVYKCLHFIIEIKQIHRKTDGMHILNGLPIARAFITWNDHGVVFNPASALLQSIRNMQAIKSGNVNTVAVHIVIC